MVAPKKFDSETANFWVLTTVASKSSPGTTYQLRKSKNDGKTYCTCPGWIHKARKSDGICKHIAAYKKGAPQEEVIVYKFDEFVAVKRGFALITDDTQLKETKTRRS